MAFGEKEVNGIQETVMDKLILDICNYNDDINNTLNSIDEEFYKGLSSINCDISTSLKMMYEDIQQNYKLVNSNILSYSTDYAKVKDAYFERASSIVKQVTNMTDEHRQLDNYTEGR